MSNETCTVNVEAIPQELKDISNWILWKAETNDKGQSTKVPYAVDGYKVGTTSKHRDRWATFDKVTRAYERGGFSGIGFVFTNTGLVGIDIDHCLDGQMLPEYDAIVDSIGSYTEKSVSGTGLHIIAKASIPRARKPGSGKYRGLEIYGSARYFTMTGNVYNGYDTVSTRDIEIGALWEMVNASMESRPQGAQSPSACVTCASDNLTDYKLIEKMRNAKNGAKFTALWEGSDPTGDTSAADYSLCAMLAFWTCKDQERVDRLFRQSGRMRSKWDEVHGQQTYGELTIRNAVAQCTEVYKMEQSDPNDVQAILAQIEKAEGFERVPLINKLAQAISGLDLVTAEIALNQAKKLGISKMMLRDAISDTEESESDNGKIDSAHLAEIWQEEHPDTAWGLGEWRRYQEGYWPTIDEHIVRQEIQDICKANRHRGVKVESGKVSSVHGLAQDNVFIPVDTWNNQDNVIVLTNGTLDLNTMQLREHSEEDYVTQTTGYAFDASATCPTFLSALNRIQDAYFEEGERELYHDGDLSIQEFIQEFAGLCLTKDTSKEIALWFQSLPGMGKSTIIAGFEAMLGEYAGLLGLGDIERSQFALSQLPGKRLVTCAEQPIGYMRATHILNNIISGEPVKVELKFQKPYDVKPHAKVLWAMNKLPRLDASDGLFRRVKVVKFPTLLASKKDTTLKAKIEAERAGIFNWALEGLKRLQGRGRFIIPASVQKWTEEFKNENDKVALFIEERCILDPGNDSANVVSSVLYESYKTWCLDNGFQPESINSMRSEWVRFGAVHYRSGGHSKFRYLTLQ